ncbi:MAG: hypothetical protein LAN61_12350 [Acidobacteriia bacterium]|nr:hypothetical protein [Terriglobia bacterium]
MSFVNRQTAWKRLAGAAACGLVCAAGWVPLAAQQPAMPPATPVAVAVFPDRVRLRWEPPDVYPAGGYVIYRDAERLTPEPLKPVAMGEPPKTRSDRPEDIDNAYLFLINSPKVTKEQRSRLENVKIFVLLRSIDTPKIATDLALLYDDTTAKKGALYQYRLVALDAAGQETTLNATPVLVEVTPPPPPPSNLVATSSGENGIGLKWQTVPPRGATDPAGYYVYRSLMAGGAYQRITQKVVLVMRARDAQGHVTEPTFYATDGNVEDGVIYKYRVTGVDFFGRESAPIESPPIEYVDPRPPLSVAGFAAQASAKEVTLTWTVPEKSRIAVTIIKRSESIEGPFLDVSPELPAATPTFADSTVVTGRKYFYRAETRSRRGLYNPEPPTVLATVVNPVPPASVRHLQASAKLGQVALSWDKNAESDLLGYRVYRSLEEKGPWALVGDELIGGVQYADEVSALRHDRLWYRVVAVNTSRVESQPSPAFLVETRSVAAPRTPSLSTGPMTEGKILLQWTGGDAGTTGFNLYRAILEGYPMVRLNEKPLPAAQLQYTDTDVEPDHPYYYVVEAVGANGALSPRSQIASASTFSRAPAPMPADLHAEFYVPREPLGVTLTWKMPEKARLRCEVLRSELPDEGFVRVGSLLFEGQMKYTDSSVSVGSTYYYVVRATSPSGMVSANSAAVKVTVPPPPPQR